MVKIEQNPPIKIYSPANIDAVYRSLPVKGRRVQIQWAIRDDNRVKTKSDKTRTAVIIQKVNTGAQSFFTIELEPENKVGKMGRYRMAFHASEIILGKVKIVEVV